MLNTANIYIDLLNKIKESGGAVPPELVAEVEALDVTVNGDETTEPPTVGLVDIVGDLGDEVEDLDIDINGDDTTEPPTPGLKDRVGDLETDINGDSSTTPATPGIKDKVSVLESHILGSQVNIITYVTASSPYVTLKPGYARVRACGLRIGDSDSNALLILPSGTSDYYSTYVPAGTKIYLDNVTADSTAVFIQLT